MATSAQIAGEPFSRPMREKGIEADTPGYEQYVDKVLRSKDIIKHIWGSLTEEQNIRLLKNPRMGRILFLYRQDNFSTALSQLIAQQRRQWDRPSPDSLPARMRPIPIREIQAQMEFFAMGIERYKTLLKENGIPFRSITYEDIYDEKLSQAERETNLSDLCSYFGLKPQNIAEAAKLLEPSARYNSPSIYKELPNWANIEAKLLKKEDSMGEMAKSL